MINPLLTCFSIIEDEYNRGDNSSEAIKNRVKLLNRYLGRVKLFYGSYLKQMPILLSERRVPMSISQVMQMGLNTKNTLDKDFWTSLICDTGDAIAYHPDGRIKIILDSIHLRKFSFVEKAMNKLNASIIAPEGEGAIKLSETDYESLEGMELFEKDIKQYVIRGYNPNRKEGMSVKEAKSNPIWRFLARDKSFLGDYVDYISVENKGKDIMDIVLRKPSEIPILLPLRIENERIDGAFYGVNWWDSRLFTLPVNFQLRKLQKAPRKNLERELISSRADNIEKAINSLTFEQDGSLHIKGYYDKDEKITTYSEIIKKIPKDKLAKIRETLENNLPSLKISEGINSEVIKRYFKEKFGVPIENYDDVELFYQSLLKQELK
jgi:hypothetical protein